MRETGVIEVCSRSQDNHNRGWKLVRSAVRPNKEGSVMHTKCESCKVSLIMENFSVYDKGYGTHMLMLSFAFPFLRRPNTREIFNWWTIYALLLRCPFLIWPTQTMCIFIYSFIYFWPHHMWDLSFLTRDWTHTPRIISAESEPWAAREVPAFAFVVQTPWTAAHQVSLSLTISLSLLKLMFIESVMSSNHFIFCLALDLS